jgi:Spy/CpxP family protein refolding chaperone
MKQKDKTTNNLRRYIAMRKISFFVVLALVLTFGTLSAAGFHGEGGRMGHKWGGMHPSILTSLDLTAEQAEKIRSLRESFHKETAPLRTQEFERRAELRLLWMQLKPDAEMIKAKQKEIHDLRWQIKEKRTDFRLAFRDTLTSEQLSKFLALGSEWGSPRRMGKRHHHGHGKKWGPSE